MTILSKAAEFQAPPAGLHPLERKDWRADQVGGLNSEVKQVVGQIVSAFEAFKDANDRRLAQIERKQEDVITQIETATVNDTVSQLQDQLATLEENLKIAEMAQKAEDVAAIQQTVADLATTVGELQAAAERPALEEDVESPVEVAAGLRGRRVPIHLAKEMARANRKFAAWLRTGCVDGREVKELSTFDEVLSKAMSVGANPDGGYTVIPFIDQTVTRIMSQVSDIRAIATVTPISTDRYQKHHITDGVGAGWVGEQDSRAATAGFTLSQQTWETNELYANVPVTQSLLDDSFINIEEYVSNEIAVKFAELEGTAFVSGDGVKRPRGFLSQTNVAQSSWAWGKIGYVVTGASGAFKHDNDASPPVVGGDAILSLVYALKSAYRNQTGAQEFGTNQGGDGARFVMNRTTEAECRKLKDVNGQYLWQPGLQAGAPALLAGYPVTNAEDMPDIAADSYSIAFGNFRRGYRIIERIGIRMLRDPYSSKPNVLFYATKRVGGNVDDYDAIKLLKFGTS